jgi:MFS family permease
MVALDARRSNRGMGGTRAEIASARCAAHRLHSCVCARSRVRIRRGCRYAGAVAGPLGALAIVNFWPRGSGDLHSFNIIFWLAAVPGVLAALSILTLVKERKHPTLKGETFAGSLRMLPASFRRYLTGVFIFGCGDFSHTMLIMYAVQSLAPRYGESAGVIAIQLYALHNFLYAVGAYPAGMLADRFGKRGFLIGAYALAALMNLLLIAVAPSIVSLILVFVLAGSAYAAQQSLERAIAADIAPIKVRSTGFGVLAAVNGIGDLVSSAIVGVLWTAFSPTIAFSYAFVMTFVGAVSTMVALRSVKVATNA